MLLRGLIQQNYCSICWRQLFWLSSQTSCIVWSHWLKHFNAMFGVSLTDLLQRLVFVTALALVLSIDHIVPTHLWLHFAGSQFITQLLQKWKQSITENCERDGKKLFHTCWALSCKFNKCQHIHMPSLKVSYTNKIILCVAVYVYIQHWHLWS